jgi:hypothetical protein
MTDGNFDLNPPRVVADGDDVDTALAWVPELPLPGQRWTVRRKAAVVVALRGGWVPVEDVSRLYDLSADEIVAWERDLDRYGVHGLRSTRLQIYRNTDNAKKGASPPRAFGTRFLDGTRYRRLA